MFYDVTSQISLYLKIMIQTHKTVLQLPITNIDREEIYFFISRMSWNVDIYPVAGYKALNPLYLSFVSSALECIYSGLFLVECAEHAVRGAPLLLSWGKPCISYSTARLTSDWLQEPAKTELPEKLLDAPPLKIPDK
jgi:hypothetical protein